MDYCECGKIATSYVDDEDEYYYLCDDCADQFPPICSSCDGSGLPSTGPIDRGRCSCCGGSGVTTRAELIPLNIKMLGRSEDE